MKVEDVRHPIIKPFFFGSPNSMSFVLEKLNGAMKTDDTWLCMLLFDVPSSADRF